jgi:predicted nucleotide-binding protein
MVDVSAVKSAIESKANLSRRQVNRLVSQKADSALLPPDLAVLALAKERGVSIQKYASAEELSHLRNATSGSTTSNAQASPPSAPQRSRPARSTSPRHAAAPKPKPKGKKVFVVHGRHEGLRKDLFAFLRALDLEPMEWNTGIKEAGKGLPSVMDVINALFAKAVAVVVLLTPDDLVVLKPEHQKAHDPKIEKEQVGQARPNVLFEAGMAISSHPDRTVFVQVGEVKPFTDVGGLMITHLNNSFEKRNEFVTKLETAKCQVNRGNADWVSTGNFEQDTY